MCNNIQDKSELCRFGQASRKPFGAVLEFAGVVGSREQQPGHTRTHTVGTLSWLLLHRDGSCSGAAWEPPQLLLI